LLADGVPVRAVANVDRGFCQDKAGNCQSFAVAAPVCIGDNNPGAHHGGKTAGEAHASPVAFEEGGRVRANKTFVGITQVTANIAIVALCGLIGWLALHRKAGAPAEDQPSRLPPIYSVGESIDTVRGLDFRAARSTLVMVIREDCHFCQESLPFYRRLADARRNRPDAGLRLAVLSTDASDVLAPYLSRNQVGVDTVLQIESGALKVPGTPTLLLVDSAGKILNVWRGKLPQRQEVEVLKTLGLGE
jgi:hypothetical protein